MASPIKRIGTEHMSSCNKIIEELFPKNTGGDQELSVLGYSVLGVLFRKKSGKPVNLAFAGSNRLLLVHGSELYIGLQSHTKPIGYSRYISTTSKHATNQLN